jgi:glycosyltransferase involved in cell wall biosynthesis
MDFAARYLERAGYEVETITYVPFYKASQYDLIICSRPGVDMLEFLKVCLIGGKRVVVDLDDDFNSIPKHNPAYNYTGAGSNPVYLTNLRRLLQHPNVLTTYASDELVNRYKNDGVIIPNSWDDENKNWEFGKPKHDTINIGFTGTATHREDFNIIEPVIKKILDEYKNVRFVCQLDEQIYKRFLLYPEEQKLFLPPLPFVDYPLSYRMFDILVVPLRDTHFNRAKSDIKLLECGVSKTPYVASNLPFYSEWGVGGFTVADDGWEQALRTLIESEQTRREMGEAGYEKAQTRKASLVNNKWVELADRLCA